MLEKTGMGLAALGASLVLIVILSGGTGTPALGCGVLAVCATTVAGFLAAMAQGTGVRRALQVVQFMGLVVTASALVAIFL